MVYKCRNDDQQYELIIKYLCKKKHHQPKIYGVGEGDSNWGLTRCEDDDKLPQTNFAYFIEEHIESTTEPLNIVDNEIQMKNILRTIANFHHDKGLLKVVSAKESWQLLELEKFWEVIDKVDS